MAWVWLTMLTLARLNTATDQHLGRRPAVLEAQFPGTEPPRRTEGGEKSYYAPVWKSLEGTCLPVLLFNFIEMVKMIYFFFTPLFS